MATNVDDKIKKLRPLQRKKVETRAAELIAEEMTLRELRHTRKLTQVRMAKKLGITQDSVSRLEQRSDLLLSTLRKTIEAMGGNLSLLAGHKEVDAALWRACDAHGSSRRMTLLRNQPSSGLA